MVGFSLAHGPGAFLLLCPVLLVIWLLAVVVLSTRSLVRKNRISVSRWLGIGVAVLILLLLGAPANYWQRVFIRKMAASPHSGELLVYAAYESDLGTVKALASHGVSVNATDPWDGRTGLHAAAIAGDLAIVRFLLSKGADLNTLDHSGDSPLELAASRKHRDVAEYLAGHGAKDIRGSEAQHQGTIEDEVTRSVEQLNRAQAAGRELQQPIKHGERDQRRKPKKAKSGSNE